MTKKNTYRFLLFIFLFNIIFFNRISVQANETFSSWLESYKKFALSKGISQKTLDLALGDVKFLNQVIKVKTKLTPLKLLKTCKEIEIILGRIEYNL